jgi:hypothetical protein
MGCGAVIASEHYLYITTRKPASPWHSVLTRRPIAATRWRMSRLSRSVVYPTTADNYFAPKTGYNAPNSTCFGGGKAMVSHLFYW